LHCKCLLLTQSGHLHTLRFVSPQNGTKDRFRLGQRRMLRDRVAQVIPEWENTVPGYASVLAMYAFGLEENGHYRQAEKIARRALAIDPRHPGAIHVIAHVMEMQGRALEGLEFLAATDSAWMDTTGISVHLAWHRALFHLDADDPGVCARGLRCTDRECAHQGDVVGRWNATTNRYRLRNQNGSTVR
jgi:hypothetical protein